MNSKFSEIRFLIHKEAQLYTTICVSLSFTSFSQKIFVLCQVLIWLLFLSLDIRIFASGTGEINFLMNCYYKNMTSPLPLGRGWSQIISQWFQVYLNKHRSANCQLKEKPNIQRQYLNDINIELKKPI